MGFFLCGLFLVCGDLVFLKKGPKDEKPVGGSTGFYSIWLMKQ